MLSTHFRRFGVLFVVVGLLTAVLVMVTAVTAQPPVLPGTPEERANLPYWPQTEEEIPSDNQVLSPESLIWGKGVFQSFRDNNWEIYSSIYDQQNAIRLTADGASDIHPRLNRGATRVVFSSNRDGDYEVYVMNVNGSGVKALTNNTAVDVNPVWSQDGSRIAFQSYRDGQSEIYVMNADGSGQMRLTAHDSYDGDPTWSPDGSKIAFRSNRTGTPFIYVMNSNGTGVVQLSTQPSYYVAWSPDGSQIAYSADLDGDNFFELWLMNADGSNQHMVFNPYEQQTDAWVRGWSPDGREITFTQIHFIQYQGNWYWNWALIYSFDLPNNWATSLDQTGLDWHPDWQTTDVSPPQTEIETMPAFSQPPGFHVSWSGADQESGSGLAAYDVQYRVGASGPWVDWQTGVMEKTSAAYTAVPGTTVTFRSRGRDNAYNWEPWTTFGNPSTTFYTWSLGGKLTDNRGAPIVQAPISVAPIPLNEAKTDNAGNFFSRLVTNGSHTLDVIRSGYGNLAQTTLNMEKLAHIYLPPGNNALQNGGFEAAQPLADWTTTGTVTAVTTPRHTGTKSTLIGNTNCPYPCLTADEEAHFDTIIAPNIAADSQGILHLVDIEEYGQIIYANRLITGEWSLPQTLSLETGAHPMLAIDPNDELHVLWANNNQIVYSNKSSGIPWSMPTVVTTFANEVTVTSLVADSQGGLHALIEIGGNSFYLFRQPDGIWQTPVLLAMTEHPLYYKNGLMTIGSDDTLHFIWTQQYVNASPTIFELIYQQRYSDGTWGNKIAFPIAGDVFQIVLQSMAITPDGTLHVVWTGRVDSQDEAFHAIRAANGVWSAPFIIHQDDNKTITSVYLSADSQGNVHAVYSATDYYVLGNYYRLWRSGIGWQPEASLGNGVFSGFESISTVDSYDIIHLLASDRNANGNYFHSLPATTNSTASLSQEVSIPANMSASTLAFMAQRPGDVPGDDSGLELLVSDGVTTTVVPLSNGGAAWSNYWADMSPWTGKTVTVNFRLIQVSGDPQVRAAIDDVTLGSAYPDTWVSGNGPGSALPGETVVFRMEYGNRGLVAAANGELTATWPDSLTFVSANITPTWSADTLTWSLGELTAESAPQTIVVTATLDASTAYWETIQMPFSIHSTASEVEQLNNQVVISFDVVHRMFLPVLFKP